MAYISGIKFLNTFKTVRFYKVLYINIFSDRTQIVEFLIIRVYSVHEEGVLACKQCCGSNMQESNTGTFDTIHVLTFFDMKWGGVLFTGKET